MPLTAAQIVTLACQDAKCPGFTQQGGQFLNAALQDYCQNYDLEAALGTYNFSFNSGAGQGSGPYVLPADYLRTRVQDGKDDFFYTIDGVPYPLIQCTKAEYDWMVQTPGFQNFPYYYATDLSPVTLGQPAQLFVWPPSSGSYVCVMRYWRQMPDIPTPETSNTVPWFSNTMILQRDVAGRLMGLTGDSRQAEYLGDNDDRYPLGVGTLMRKYLKNIEDREGAVHTVGRDRRRWGRSFDLLKNTKTIGWLLPFLALALAWFVPPAPANACTAPCTKTQITTDINTNWPDNTTGAITPALLRSTVLELVNSYLDTNGTSAFNCSSHQFLVSIATLSTYSCAQPGVGDLSGLATGVSGALGTAVNTVGGFTVFASQTANTIYKGNGSSAPVASSITDNGTIVSTSEPIDTTNSAHLQEIANAGSTGTTVNKLAKLTGSPGTAVIATTSDTTGNVIGIVTGGAGTAGNAQIAITGQASCIFDGAITSGHYVQVSTTAGGSCHDSGATFPTAGQVLGIVLAATNASPGSTPQAVALFPPVILGTNASSSGTVTTITAGNGIALSSGATCTTTCTITVSNGTSTVTGASTTFTSAQNNTLVQRSNSGAAMGDTLPGTSPGVLPANTQITITNADASAVESVKVGTGSLLKTSSSNGFVYICPGQTKTFYSDGTNYWEISAQSRCRLAANTSFYVATTGSTSNDGLTVSNPFLEGSAAYQVVQNWFDVNCKQVTFNVANGTYGQLSLIGPLVGLCGLSNFNRTTVPVLFVGNAGSPSSVNISTSSNFGAIQVEYGAVANFNGFQATNSVSNGVFAHFSAVVQIQNFVFPATGAFNHIVSEWYSDVVLFGSYTITGGAGCHMTTSNMGQIETNGASPPTVTLTGTPNFTSAFMCVQYPGTFINQGGTAIYSGAATGARYSIGTSGGYINSGGQGANFFPGNSAGTASSTQYQ